MAIRRLSKAISLVLQDSIVKTKDEKDDKNFFKRAPILNAFREDLLASSKTDFAKDQCLLQAIRKPPSVQVIRVFVEAICDEFDISEYAAVQAIIYLNRFLLIVDSFLHPVTWRPIVLSAFLLAHKMTEDHCASNTDWAYFYPIVTIAELMQLELKFLDVLNWKPHISAELYGKYLLELYSLVPLKPQRGDRLQTMPPIKLPDITARTKSNGSQKSLFSVANNTTSAHTSSITSSLASALTPSASDADVAVAVAASMSPVSLAPSSMTGSTTGPIKKSPPRRKAKHATLTMPSMSRPPLIHKQSSVKDCLDLPSSTSSSACSSPSSSSSSSSPAASFPSAPRSYISPLPSLRSASFPSTFQLQARPPTTEVSKRVILRAK